jgi:hypothetical protein
MPRPLGLGFLLLVLFGCTPAGNSSGEAALAPKERTAWDKYRRSGVTAPDYRIAVYRLKEKAWRLYSPEGGWKSRLEGAGIHEEEEARATAKRAASQPNNKAVALLEMLQEQDPEIVEWEVDDGRGAQSSERAPSAELERSLKDFILQLQRSASRG